MKNGDPRKTLEKLINERYPVYAKAPIMIDTDAETLNSTVDKIISALTTHSPETRSPETRSPTTDD